MAVLPSYTWCLMKLSWRNGEDPTIGCEMTTGNWQRTWWRTKAHFGAFTPIPQPFDRVDEIHSPLRRSYSRSSISHSPCRRSAISITANAGLRLLSTLALALPLPFRCDCNYCSRHHRRCHFSVATSACRHRSAPFRSTSPSACLSCSRCDHSSRLPNLDVVRRLPLPCCRLVRDDKQLRSFSAKWSLNFSNHLCKRRKMGNIFTLVLNSQSTNRRGGSIIRPSSVRFLVPFFVSSPPSPSSLFHSLHAISLRLE